MKHNNSSFFIATKFLHFNMGNP